MADEILTHTYVIYKVTCLPMNMSYIGMTNNEDRRQKEHRGDSTNKKLRAAYTLYEDHDFTFEVIQRDLTKKEARIKEMEMIRSHNTAWPNGFNLHGGDGYENGPDYERTRQRRAAAQKKLWNKPGHREIVSERVRAYWATPEGRARSTALSKERWKNPEYIEKQRQSHWSKTHSVETREKIRQIALARSEKQRAEIGPIEKPDWLISSCAESWADPARKQRRVAAVKSAWSGEEGEKRRKLLAAIMSEENKKRGADPTYAERLRQSLAKRRGYKHPEETKQKMREAKRISRERRLSKKEGD